MGTLISWTSRPDGEKAGGSKMVVKQALSTVIDAVTSPGTIKLVPTPDQAVPAPWPAAIGRVAQILLSKHARLSVLGQSAGSLTRHLIEQTGAQPVRMHQADYIIAGHPLDWLDVWAICATDRASRRGATLMLSSRFLMPVDPAEREEAGFAECSPEMYEEDEISSRVARLSNRTAGGRRALIVCDEAANLLRRLAVRIAERPTHVDVVLADEAGHMVALPYGTWWPEGRTIWAA